MSELRILITDETFVDDLNAAGIEGIYAEHDPTMAYDTVEHIYEIVVTGIAVKSFELFAQWLIDRLKKKPPEQFTIVNSGENAVNIINYISSEAKRAQRRKPPATKTAKPKKPPSK